jgi:hypothetical protein
LRPGDHGMKLVIANCPIILLIFFTLRHFIFHDLDLGSL